MTARTARPFFIATALVVALLATVLWLRWLDSTSVLAAGHNETVYKVEEGDSLDSIAYQYGVTVDDIIAANADYPGYLYKSQTLIIPAHDEMPVASSSMDAPASLAGSETSDSANTQLAASSDMSADTPVDYKVKEGDSFASIARQHGVEVDALIAANVGIPAHLYVGQKLTIPSSAHLAMSDEGATEEETTTETSSVDVSQPEQSAAESSEPVTEGQASADMGAAKSATYAVKEGDNLHIIAETYGISVDDLLAANPDYPGYLYKKQILTIPPANGMSHDMSEVAGEESMVAEEAPMAGEDDSEMLGAADVTHVVKEGDSLRSIAGQYGVTVDDLLAANPDYPGYLYKKQKLTIPSSHDMASMQIATPAEEGVADADTSIADEEAMPTDENQTEEGSSPEGEDATEESDGAAQENQVEASEPESVDADGADADSTEMDTSQETDAVAPEANAEAAVEDEPAADEPESETVTDEAVSEESVSEESVSEESVSEESMTTDEQDVEAAPADEPSEVDADPEVTPPAEEAATDEGESEEAMEETMTEEVVAEEGAAEQTVEVVVGAPAATETAVAWTIGEGQAELFSPDGGGGYHSPIEIIGLSSTSDGAVRLALVTAGGDVIAERTAIGGSADAHAFFHSYLRFAVQEATPATLYIYGGDNETGEIVAIAEIPLVVLPGQRIIDVSYPPPGAAVCASIDVEGYSNTFEANVVVELRHQSDDSAGQVAAMGGNLGVYREFSTTFQEPVTEPSAILASAYATDASGAYPYIDKTVVPITAYPAGSDQCPN